MSQQTPSGGHRGPGKLSYGHYINSARWERRKLAYYANHHRICRACGAREDIHLHHHTYERMGNEFDADLVPLCEPCHVAVHRFHRATKLTLTAATRQFLQLLGADLEAPRRRGKSQRGRPLKTGKGSGKIRIPQREPMVRLAEVIAEFGVPQKALRFQGYQRKVPLSVVMRWRAQRPVWM